MLEVIFKVFKVVIKVLNIFASLGLFYLDLDLINKNILKL